MWKPMAEALGWGKRPIGREDLFKLAQSKDGWASKGRPEWGTFRYGHPHPDYTLVGLGAVTTMVAAAVGKTRGFTEKDFETREASRL
jgi:Ca-activated chloride channel family protein